MAYVPKFFFAATLIFIAIDLLFEWLVLVYFKLLLREYLVVLGSFVLLNVYGLETGMALSIGLAMVGFIWSYSRTAKRVVTRVVKQSNVLAAPNDRMQLRLTVRPGSRARRSRRSVSWPGGMSPSWEPRGR